jgi:hypothetical protein
MSKKSNATKSILKVAKLADLNAQIAVLEAHNEQLDQVVNGAHLPPKFGVDVLTIVRNIGFGFACWAYL